MVSLFARGASNTVVSSAYRISTTAAGHSYAPALAADGNRVVFLSHAANLVTNENLGPHLNLFVRDVFANNTALVSVSTNGGGANASVTRFYISSIGSIVFETAASNLTHNDTNDVSDVFLRDLNNMTRLISVNAAGTAPGNGRSFNPIVSRYGERVVFESEASDLVPNDTNGVADIFVRDLFRGQTRLVSVNAAGDGPGNGRSHSPSMPDYGEVVAFVSLATDLVSGVTNTLGEVYVRSLINNTTRWAMAGLTPTSSECLRHSCPGRPDGYVPSEPITVDGGGAVVFKLGGHSVVRWEFPYSGNITNERVHTLAIEQGETLGPWPLLSGFGAGLVGYVVGRTDGAGAMINSWLRRINFNIPVETVSPASGQTSYVYAAQNVVSGPPVIGNVFGPSMSSDGNRFIFASDSTRLLPSPTDGSTQVYYHEMGAPYSVLLSVKSNGTLGPDLNGVVPSATRWGRAVVWDTPDSTVVPDDLNGAYDVVLRDLDQNRTTLVSMRHPVRPASTSLGASRLGAGGLSGNGRIVAFTSEDGSFVANDTNRWEDVFALNLISGARARLTVSPMRVKPFPPTLNADGRFAVFEQSLYGQGALPVTNSFRADLLNNTLISVAQSLGGATVAAGNPSMSPDGHFVAFHSSEPAGNLTSFGPNDSNTASDVFVRDFTTNVPANNVIVASIARTHFTTGNAESRVPVVSADARWVAFHSLATDLTFDSFPNPRHHVFAYDQTRGTVKLLSYTPSGFNSNSTALSVAATNPVFSADSRFVFFTVNSNTTTMSVSNMAIFRHDLINDPVITTTQIPVGGTTILRTNLTRLTNVLVCTGCANPSVSADGQLVAYEWGAGATTNVVVKDLQMGTSEFISLYGNIPGRAHRPLLSLDGHYVVFTTTSTGPFLDTNNATDIFVRDRRTGFTHVVSRSRRRAGPFTGPPPDTGNGLSSDPVMSYDGRTVAFHSFASDLVAGDYNDARDVFVLNLSSGDVDGDGMDDDWELSYFNTLTFRGDDDVDGDGANNLAEFRAGTDPTNEGSVFQVLTLTLAGNWAAPVPRATITVFWSAVPGRIYRVQAKSSVDAPWMDVPGDVVAFTPSKSKTFEITFPPSQGYFRAVAGP
jgi:Tol biopolymer transport system component